MYDPNSTYWTWLAGKAWGDGKPDLPVHGISGEFSSANTPGAAPSSQAVDSVDANGEFKFVVDGEAWKYSLISNQWAWINSIMKTSGESSSSSCVVVQRWLSGQ